MWVIPCSFIVVVVVVVVVVTTVTLNNAGLLNLNFLAAVGEGSQESFSTRLVKPTSGSRFTTTHHSRVLPRTGKPSEPHFIYNIDIHIAGAHHSSGLPLLSRQHVCTQLTFFIKYGTEIDIK
jgi:hypothetical protein